ncbi:hypothetical protein GM418_20020 [Maribellus comscasis]|jgi:uncharacterized protein (TIGR00369 family)|uniref:Acyl-coenzyme A thioesterase THEM4 n=1 Tax=Maribellus comscasis TaxID=2681766 RepID=A0A6I6K795_9BACT|nr:PaaI family thioesterase [Maribellus comscasis]MBN2747817.1 PaaI family thioesterase [Bacteroidales bacterium]QGY45874.1 hypothetical protein GM418_20020 [Maribellus comscasis]
MKIPDEFQHLTPYNMNSYTDSFVSGKQQKYIELQYYRDENSLKFYARVLFHVETQGAPGIVHGGAIASVLDETMGAVSFLNKMPAVTASLTVNYHRPLPVEKTVYIITQVEKTEGRKIYIIGKMVDKNQRLFADSKGIFVKVPNERIGL